MGEEADADWQAGLIEMGQENAAMPKMIKLRIQAQHLQPGDVVGSREKVLATIINAVKLPSDKIWVKLETKESFRCAQWGKYTMINVEREKVKV